MMLPVRWTGPPVGPQVKEWKPRALAVASKMRSRALPDVPTMAEIGYPDIEGEAWFAVIVPARTPKEIITLLHQEVVKLIRAAAMKERLATLSFEPVGNTPEECATKFKTEIAKWAKVIRQTSIKAQ